MRRRRRRRRTTVIKSNNPHLAGGEKMIRFLGLAPGNNGESGSINTAGEEFEQQLTKLDWGSWLSPWQ